MPAPRLLIAAVTATVLAVGLGLGVTGSPEPSLTADPPSPAILADRAPEPPRTPSATPSPTTSGTPRTSPSVRAEERGEARGSVSASSASRGSATARATSGRADRTPRFRLLQRPEPLELKPPEPQPVSFRIGTLNVLGSQHTRGDGGYGPGTARTSRAVGMFYSRGVDVLGLQEVQDDQLNVLYGQLGGFGIWPGRGLGNNGVRLQIAYRTSRFTLVDSGYISTRFDFQTRPIPYVQLESTETGARFWVVNIHNSPRTQEADRDSATAAEIALFNRLRASGDPVLVTGDMNEKEEWFCKVAVGAGMVAANGGSGVGGCSLPPGPLRIDWIMGGGGVSFSGYVQDGASLAGISDHYFIHADVTVLP